jgi:hypothetical protein
MLMRGVAVVLGYLVGLAAIVSIGIVGLMALQSPIESTPSAPVAATAAHKERLAKPAKQTTVAQKDAHPNQKRKTVHATRRRTEDAPALAASNFNAYGYAQEPRRAYGYPLPFFGR